MRWRKATWAIIIWTALCALLLLVGVLDPPGESAEQYGAFYTIAVGGSIVFTWFIGLLILTIVWLWSRPKQNTLIHGPQGQWVVVTEQEAKRRVEREGWTYRPPQLYPEQPYPQRPYPQQYQGQHPPPGGPRPPAGPRKP